MSTSTTHASLFDQLHGAERQRAWSAFEQRYRRLVLGFARRVGLSSNDAEDVLQTVMMRLTKRLKTFDYQPEKGRFRDWLGVVVRRAALEEVRRKRPARLATGVAEAASDPSSDHTAILWEREWELHHYRTAMRALRTELEPRSLAIFEQLLAGRDIDAVATDFSIGAEAVRKVKQRVRARLAKRIAEQVDREDRHA